jgi:hypothetical protein
MGWLLGFSNSANPDEAEVRKTHHKYGYYLDKCLYNEVRDLDAVDVASLTSY